MTGARASFAAAWLVATFTLAPRLVAQALGEARAQADRAFEEGKQLLQQGDWAGACSRFEQSFSLDPAPSTSIKLARCREHEGRFASAEREYQRAAELNQRLTERPDRKADLAAVIRDGRAAVASKIAYLVLSIAPRVAGLAVTLDGEKLSDGALAAPLPVDPGEHDVIVRAPEYRTERWQPKVTEGSKNDIALTLVREAPPGPPPAASASAGAAAVPPSSAVAPERGDQPKPPAKSPATSSQRTVAFVVGGAGVAALGVAAFFGVRTLALVNQSDDHCDSDGACDSDGVLLIQDAGDSQTIALVSAGAGVALVGIAAGLYFSAPSPTNASRGRRLVVSLGPRGAKIEGSF